MTRSKPKNLPASIRQRLLNIAKQKNEDFQFVLNRYGVERLLYRLSISPHSGQFVLKGAMLFQLWTRQQHRATLDVDLLGSGDSGLGRMVKLFQSVCAQQIEDDGLVFLTDSARGEEIREDQRYRGVRVHIVATLGAVRIPIQIDVGFGDVITPRPQKLQYPTMLDLPSPTLQSYPRETVVAEKYEAMVSLGIANSRMKDFYDVWVLARDFDFEGIVLAAAIRATFSRRGTALPKEPPIALTPAFAADRSKTTQWSAFIKRGSLVSRPPGFTTVIASISSFLWPVSVSLSGGDDFKKSWSAGGPWT